jgi:hypothetical protein
MIENNPFENRSVLAVVTAFFSLWLTLVTIVKSYQELIINRQVIELNEYDLIDRRLDNLFNPK